MTIEEERDLLRAKLAEAVVIIEHTIKEIDAVYATLGLVDYVAVKEMKAAAQKWKETLPL